MIEDGQSGILVNSVDEAAQAVQRSGEIDRITCRKRVEERFSIGSMVDGYELVYHKIFDLEAKRRS